MMNTLMTTHMRGCLCESCKREVGKEMFARGGVWGGGGAPKCPQEHLRVSTLSAGGGDV